MAELSEKIAKKQFDKFSRAYNKLRNINLAWDSYDKNREGGWDFKGKDENEIIFPIEYTEGIVNKKMKANFEAFKKGKYTFRFAPRNKFATEIVEQSYGKKIIKAGKGTILLIGFHDVFYAEENSKFDGIEVIKEHMIKKFKENLFKEVWIINLADERCYFVF